MMRAIRLAVGIAAAFLITTVAVGTTEAANETASYDFSMQPQNGTFYKEAPRPADWRVEVEIKAPFPQSPEVQPLKEIRADFPDEMSFNPDPKMPVCPDDQIGPSKDLSFPPEIIIKRCPKSVLGNGKAYLYLSKTNNVNGPTLRDAVLIAFNGGRNSQGLPKLKIYGFSAGVNTGVYMEGVLKDSKLTVPIPVLAFDSGTGYFDLNIPGTNNPKPSYRGLDKDYVRTTCKASPWTGDTEFTLGTRDTAGNPTSPDSIVKPPPLKVPCSGAVGAAKFSKVKVKGPGKVKSGGTGTYRVSVTNSGTATARGLTVRASGKGAKGKTKACLLYTSDAADE